MKNNPPSTVSVSPGDRAIPSSLRSVFIIATAVIVMLIVCLTVTHVLIRHYSKHRPMQPMYPYGIITAPDNKLLTDFPGPSLELDDGHADLVALRQRQTEKLNSYGWVDRTNKIVRIPIERAMDLIISRGFPVANPDEATAPLKLPPNEEGALP